MALRDPESRYEMVCGRVNHEVADENHEVTPETTQGPGGRLSGCRGPISGRSRSA
jgi:hypothetical protein